MSQDPSNTSQVGEGWHNLYLKGELSWCNPEVVSVDYFVRHSRSEWITRMLRYSALQPSPDVKVLEAGCGTATYSIALSLLGFSVDAFDYSPAALSIARSLVKKVELRNRLRIRLFQDDLLDVRSVSGSYDLVFNQSVLEYFTSDRERAIALSEMTRLAKPGGSVCAIVQHGAHPFSRIWKSLGWPGYTRQPPLIRLTPARLKQELQAANLTTVQVDGIYPWKGLFFWPPWYLRWRFTEHAAYLALQSLNRMVPMPGPLSRRLALHILGVGRKA